MRPSLPDGEDRGILDRWCARLGIAHWDPPGSYDPAHKIWVVPDRVGDVFPDSGIEAFNAVDDTSFWFRHRNRVITAIALRILGEPTNFLEVGAGSGVVAAALEQAGFRVAGVEPLWSGAKAIARKGITVSIASDLHSLRLPHSSFMAVGMFDVIEHLDDPSPMLVEAHRILQPKGALFLTVPAYQWLWSDHDVWNGHCRRYTAQSLHRLLQLHGFRLAYISYFFLPLLPPAAFRAILYRIRRHPTEHTEYDQTLMHQLNPGGALVSRAIDWMLQIEARALRHTTLPAGTSLLAVAVQTDLEGRSH